MCGCKKQIDVHFVKMVDDVISPVQVHAGDSGFDIHTYEDAEILPGEIARIPTGLKFEIPKGYEIQIRPRSSFDVSPALVVFSTIDHTHRGFINISVQNRHNELTLIIPKGTRIAQIVLKETPIVNYVELKVGSLLSETSRGEKGLGSTNNDVDKLLLKYRNLEPTPWRDLYKKGAK